MPDVSVILPLHREGNYLPRTLRSLGEAALYASRVGVSTELVVILDRADFATVAALDHIDGWMFERVQILRADHGSAGLSRNAGFAAATGSHIMTADGDDLISFNYIERMWWNSCRLGELSILIPKFLFAFGDSFHITEYFDLVDITPLTLILDHPFLSRVFFHRSLLENVCYQDVSLTNRYAYEDWHFNCDAVALGYKFCTTNETILFYRQRHAGLLKNSNKISVKQIPPSLLFEPEYYSRICEPYVEKFKHSGDLRPRIAGEGKEILRDAICLELTLAANSIDPAINPEQLRASSYFNYLNADISAGMAYYRLCKVVGEEKFDEVFLLPFLTAGGADRYVLDVMSALSEQKPGLRILVIFGEPFDRYAWLDRLPKGCVAIDLCAVCPELGYHERDVLCLKLIQSCAPAARLHLRPSPFAHRFFSRFAPVLVAYRPVLYRFADARNDYGSFILTEPWGFYFMSEHLWAFDKIVCDNAGIIASDRRSTGLTPEKWQLLYSKMDLLDQVPEAAGAGNMSVLWISRIDSEKRPELLFEIAKLLALRMPETIIEVYGQPTLDAFDTDRFIKMPNVRYHGYFEKLSDIGIQEHCCFIYTSKFDGLPVILLEMIVYGLPVIAPNVGGIGELIKDGDTGILLDCTGNDSSDAEIYVSAIERFFADPDLRDATRRSARSLIAQRHSSINHFRRVAEIFASPLSPAPDIVSECVLIGGSESHG